jgi:tRNA G10  N-methylase Trm11
MYIALLGRQPALSMAELERLYGGSNVAWFSDTSATIETTAPINIESLGGSLKVGRVTATFARGDWRQISMKLVQAYSQAWKDFDGKLTLGISAYGFDASSRDIQKTGIVLKQKLKQSGTSLRLIPNQESALSSATSHHNKLGLSNNKVELMVFRSRSGKVIIAESIGAQNITALARRDQERPKRDAFVGMLPPKLAQIMINLATPASSHEALASWQHLQPELEATPGPEFKPGAKPLPRSEGRSDDNADTRGLCILDPFCGTGVLLQEAALLGYNVYGTDLSEKMIRYSRDNLNWLQETHHIKVDWYLHEGDAMTTKWQQPIDAVACEAYLGQPFSAPPSPSKLIEVRGNCDHIISAFLQNIAGQLKPGTPLCVGVPAWRATDGSFTHLPLINKLEQLGFHHIQLKNVRTNDLLYYREDQVVARELLILTKI